MADVELVIKIPEEDWEFLKGSDGCRWSRAILEAVINGIPLPKGHGRTLTNSEWIDFLSKQFDISRASAKDMLHAMMSVKREDNFKKQFSGARPKDPEAPAIEDIEEDAER